MADAPPQRRASLAFGKFQKTPQRDPDRDSTTGLSPTDLKAIEVGRKLGFTAREEDVLPPEHLVKPGAVVPSAAGTENVAAEAPEPKKVDGRSKRATGRNVQVNLKCTEPNHKRLLGLSASYGGPARFLEVLLDHWEATQHQGKAS